MWRASPDAERLTKARCSGRSAWKLCDTRMAIPLVWRASARSAIGPASGPRDAPSARSAQSGSGPERSAIWMAGVSGRREMSAR